MARRSPGINSFYVKTTFLILLGILTVLPAGAENISELHPVRLGKKFGFVDEKGTLALSADLDWAWPLTEGRAGVRRGKDWFLIDEQGKRIGLGRYDWVGPFSEGLAPARLGIRKSGIWNLRIGSL